MSKLTDNELLDELKRRFEENKEALKANRAMTRQLEDLNAKLVESEQLKGNFLSNIRNEINNPLAAIIALAESLRSPGDLDDERVASVASMIHDGALDLDFQLRTIFTGADLEAGECVPGIQNVDILKLLRDAINHLGFKARDKGVNVEFRPGNDLGDRFVVQTDGDKFGLVFSNLLANAIEFEGEQRRVVVAASEDAGTFSVSVQDFGIGIDEGDQVRIFDRFVQLDSGSTRQHGGHGLGLSVAKSVIELLDGTISVISAPAKGSTFTVTIPVRQSEKPVGDFLEDGCEFFNEPVEEF